MRGDFDEDEYDDGPVAQCYGDDETSMNMKRRTWTGYAREDVIAMLRAEVGSRGTQKELADRIGISQSWLSDILLGNRAPAGKVLEYLNMERHAIRIYRPRAPQATSCCGRPKALHGSDGSCPR